MKRCIKRCLSLLMLIRQEKSDLNNLDIFWGIKINLRHNGWIIKAGAAPDYVKIYFLMQENLQRIISCFSLVPYVPAY